jgi:hypothetical protein
VILVVVELALGATGFVLGLVIGLFVGVSICGVAWLLLEASGARSWAIGAVAEEWTAEELDKLGVAWRRLDCVPFGEQFDVDHVLVSAQGVFAVETKFTNVPWTVTSSDPGFGRAVANAAWKARKIRFLLRSSGAPTVTPMLVIWGSGAPVIDGGATLVRDVLVCEGRQAKLWRDVLRNELSMLDDEAQRRSLDALMGHVEMTEAVHG